VQSDRCHRPRKWWRLVGAWPSEISVIDGLDNNASERVIESVTLTYDYFERVNASGDAMDKFAQSLIQTLAEGEVVF